ncbi:MAG: helix-hairpin-helix domain-containing protein [Planctomycetota bacterium]|nr:helix-hairpin-helix domain-containing protein [Planctomycetota bacterium]
MQNAEIADCFDEMADLLEISGESPFRIKAYRNGSQVIRDLPESVSQLIGDGKDLTKIDGIGSTLAEKSKVLIESGHLPALEELRKKIPTTLRTLLRVPGLGAKKVAVLHRELGVKDLAELKVACDSNLVKDLKGFGAKTQQAILDGMAIAVAAGQRLRRDQADQLVDQLRNHMLANSDVDRIEFAGSYRRGKETIGDIDILVTSQKPEAVMRHFCSFPATQEIVAQGETKSSIRVQKSFQVDLRVVEADSWGAALQYFTGSKEHNVTLRGLAKKQGLKVNEYGVFRVDESDEKSRPEISPIASNKSDKAKSSKSKSPTSNSATSANSISGAEEQSVYHALGIPYILPEFRENRFEWLEDYEARASSIIQLSDIRGDLHMHTTATDGVNSIEEMKAAAIARGLCYIAITDHSKRVSMARGLDSERVLAQWREIDVINDASDTTAFLILKSIECDILENGEMDLPDEVLAQADWVMASIHYGQKQSRDQITNRILGAIAHPSVSAISHPTGRLLGRREAYQVDMDAVIQAAAEHKKLLEINASPMRLDLSDVHCMAAIAAGVQLVISTDAHSTGELDAMQYGIQVARRAGVRTEQVFNALTLEQVKSGLKRPR